MALNKIISFTKKPTDLPDVPSPSYTALEIKEHFQTPSDEILAIHDQNMDLLTSKDGAANLGAVGFNGESSTIQGAIESLKSVNPNAEMLASRTNQSGKTYENVPARLNDTDKQITDVSYNALNFGVKGDYNKTTSIGTDDTTTINNAIASISSSGGGTLLLPPNKTYLITNKIELKSNVKVAMGNNSSLFVKNASYLDSLIWAKGTNTVGVTLTADAAIGSKAIQVTSTTGIVKGDIIFLQDTQLGGLYPTEFTVVESVTSTQINLYSPLVNSYLIASTAKYFKLNPVKNINIEGLNIEFDSTANVDWLFDIRNCLNVNIESINILNHRSTTTPNNQIGVYGYLNYNINVKNCFGRNDSGNGNFIMINNSGFVTLINNKAENYPFGIGGFFSTGTIITNNNLKGVKANGNRGIKLKGSRHCIVAQNIVNGFDTGIKIEDCGDNQIISNDISNCGYDYYGGWGITTSHQTPNATYNSYNIIANNKISNQEGQGIYVGNYSNYTMVIGNLIKNTTHSSITLDAGVVGCSAEHNTCIDWGNVAINFPFNNHVNFNKCYNSNTAKNSFYVAGATPAYDNVTTFIGNIAPTNPIDPGRYPNLRVVSNNFNNNIKDYSGRIMYSNAAPTSGTYILGEKVYNTNPAASGYEGWICVTAGTPGTWKGFGTIQS